MAAFHLDASYIKQGTGRGGAKGFSQYLAREGREDASQLARYIDRDNGQDKDDLVARGSANLPSWALGNAAAFWKAADTYERHGYIVARHLEIALPRELSRAGQLDLADDIREVTVGKFAHSWAMHEPDAKDGSGLNPHIHILFTPRREDVELWRTPGQWFAKAAAHTQNPLMGGVRKDRAWEKKGHLYDVRAAVAMLTNAALTRERLAVAVDARTLKAQGITRQPIGYTHPHNTIEVEKVTAKSKALRESGAKAVEQLATYAGWQQQALKLPSLDRTYIRDLCRDHVWRYDTSPQRTAERDATVQRVFAVAMEGKTYTRRPQPTRQRPMRLPHIPRAQDPGQTRGPILAPDLGRMRAKAQGLTW